MMFSRLQSVCLVARCYLYAPIRGRATKKNLNPSKIVLVQTAKMGDMICTTPVFRALKKKFPNVKITVIGDNVNRQLLAGHPHVDDYIVFGEFTPQELIRHLRQGKFDSAICTEQAVASLAPLYLAGIPYIIATRMVKEERYLESRPYRLLRHLVITETYTTGEYYPQQYLNLLRPFGIVSSDTAKEIVFSFEAKKDIEKKLSDCGVMQGKPFLVGISLSAGNKVKQWPAEKFAQVAKYIQEKYNGKIVIVGVPGDTKERQEFLSHSNNVREICDLIGECSVEELKALVAQCSLYVANNTGPIHMAHAFGVPSIDILGPISESEFSLVGPLHKIVYVKEREKPAMTGMTCRDYDIREVKRQVDGINVKMVTDAIDEVYEKLMKEKQL